MQMSQAAHPIPFAPLDASAGGGEGLPVWDLSDLYAGQDDPKLKADLAQAGKDAQAFKARLAGKLSGIGGDALAEAIAEYEAIEEVLGRAMSFASLTFASDAQNTANGQFYQAIQEKVTEISSHLVFFTLEINLLDEALLETWSEGSPSLAGWGPWIRDLRLFRDHQLSDELERLLNEKDISGRAAWSRLFDETMANMTVTVAGQEVSVSAALNQLSDRDREKRRAAAEGVSAAFAQRIKLFSFITNTLAKDKEVMDKWRRYPTPASYRNRANMVEDEVVEALVSSVWAYLPKLSHRYYALKAKWLGMEKLQHWDRNAPLPADADTTIAWPDAVKQVRAAYHAFSPKLAEMAAPFFEKNWIDAALRPGKASGAFAHPTVPSAHPYLLLNYHGKARDVMTLAHELGHGVHQRLAADQGYLMSSTPLTLAETASVFGEMLTFQAMLNAETDPAKKRILLAGKVEDMLNTVVRQIAFYQFETKLHAARRQGELSPEDIGKIWMGIQTESLGPAFEFSEDYNVYWAYIPHFIHTPFYVYAYAFGDCLVNALYGVYKDGAVPDFEQKYLDMLAAGGTLRHQELLAPFGLSAADPEFWKRGLDVISGFIDQLEA